MITIRTVGDFLDHRYRLWLECRYCDHQTYLDLEKLAESKGRDFDLYGVFKLTCSKCGAKNPHTIVMPPDRDKSR